MCHELQISITLERDSHVGPHTSTNSPPHPIHHTPYPSYNSTPCPRPTNQHFFPILISPRHASFVANARGRNIKSFSRDRARNKIDIRHPRPAKYLTMEAPHETKVASPGAMASHPHHSHSSIYMAVTSRHGTRVPQQPSRSFSRSGSSISYTTLPIS